MNSLFEKQVYVRLSQDATSFFYTVKYGRFATARREIRLAEKAETAGLAELSDGELPRLLSMPELHAYVSRAVERRRPVQSGEHCRRP